MRTDRLLITALLMLTAAWAVVNAAVWWPEVVDDTPVFLEPQGNVRNVLADAWRLEGKPVYDLAVESVDPVALLPRDASLVETSVVPKDFAYAVVVATAVSAGGPGATVVVAVLSGLLAAAVVGLLAMEVARSRVAGAMGAALAFTSVVWWAGSYGGVSTGFTGVAAGLAASLVLLRWSDRAPALPGPIGNRFFVAGLLTGVAVGFHYATFPWWGSLLLAACLGHQSDWAVIARRIGWSAVGGLLAVTPILIFNAWLYGSPAVTGYSEFTTVLDAVGWQSGGIGFSPRAAVGNLGVYLLRPEILPLLIIAAHSRRLVDSARFAPMQRHVVVVAAGLILFVGVASSSPLWGTGTFNTNASMLRYLAPVMSFVIVAAAAGFAALWNSDAVLQRAAAIAVAAFCIGVNMSTVALQTNGMVETRDLLEATGAQQEAVLATVPDDALIVTRRLDKVLFPHRTTVTASYLVTETLPSSDVVHLYDTLPDDDELVAFIESVGDRSLYILNDTGWVSTSTQSRLDAALGGARCVADTDVEGLLVVGECSDADAST